MPAVIVGSTAYKNIVIKANLLCILIFWTGEYIIQMNTRSHEHISYIVIINLMTITTIDGNTACTPDEFNGIVSESVALFVYSTHCFIVPHCQTVISIVTNTTIINCCIRCSLTEVHTVSEVITDTTADNLHAIAIIHIPIVVTKPEATLKVIFPYMMDNTSALKDIHKAFIHCLLAMTTPQIRVQVEVTDFNIVAVAIWSMFAITARDTSSEWIRVRKLKVGVPHTSTSNLYVGCKDVPDTAQLECSSRNIKNL